MNRTLSVCLFLLFSSYVFSFAQKRPRRVPLEVQEKKAIKEGFLGLTTNGKVKPGLFKIKGTGISTSEVRKTTEAFLNSLSKEQQGETLFKVDDNEWRKWANQHHYKRQGVSFRDLTKEQRNLGFEVLRSGLSARGMKTTRDIMRLNETLAEIRNDFEEYGEWLYHLTVMGKPSKTEPWGWQFDGHHVIINYFVLGDQVVMSPVFLGSEPVRADSGKYKGTVVMQKEEAQGLKFMQSLSKKEQIAATIQSKKGPTNNLAEAFKDNLIVDNVGLKVSALDEAGKKRLLALIAVYINNNKEGHAKVRLEEIAKHLDDTYFAWIGESSNGSVFYYRIQSPVIYIEFDHQRPIGLRRSSFPTRNHIHCVIRTPNGNDYGKDLLRQHYEKHHK